MIKTIIKISLVFGILAISAKCGEKSDLKLISSLIVQTSATANTSVTLTATATYSDATTEDVTANSIWATSNAAVAKPSSTNGVISAVGAGTATISALYSGYIASAVATVTSSGAISAVSSGASTSPAGSGTGGSSSATTTGGTTTAGTTTAGTTTAGTTTSGTTTGGTSTGSSTTGGTTTGGTTGGGCGTGTLHNSACWWLTATNESCNEKCAALGMTMNTVTSTYAMADINNCGAVLTAMGNGSAQGGNVAGNRCCFIAAGQYNVGSSCDGTGKNAAWQIVCACQ